MWAVFKALGLTALGLTALGLTAWAGLKPKSWASPKNNQYKI